MKPSHLLILALAAGGCGKTTDLAPMVAETQGLVAYHQPRIDELARRAAQQTRRLDALAAAPGAADARARLGEAQTLLVGLRGEAAAAPQRAEAAAASGKADDLTRVLYGTWDRFEADLRRLTARVDGVEAWIDHVEQGRIGASAPAPAAAPPPPAPEPAPAPTPAPAAPN